MDKKLYYRDVCEAKLTKDAKKINEVSLSRVWQHYKEPNDKEKQLAKLLEPFSREPVAPEPLILYL